jgi:2-hydroxychromene-2-carboxylate isomerase
MKHITFHLDFISPYAYLAFEQLPKALKGLSYMVTHKPVLFGALLKHHGQLGPAEIPGKREWTYRQVAWLAHQQGVVLQMPATHPFNPLTLLRMAVASDAQGLPNRYVCETIFRHVWQGGLDPNDPARLTALAEQLPRQADLAGDGVKAQLKAHTDAAIAAGVFGVPSFEVDGKLFWGQDALPMLRAYLEGDAWFGSGAWEQAAQVGVGVTRPKN